MQIFPAGLIAALVLVPFFSGPAGLAQQNPFPPTHARTLSGKDVAFPSQGVPTLLLAGFTKASSDAESVWWSRAQPLCKANPKLQCFRAAVLEDVPRFIRPMVVGNMRKGTTGSEQDSFLTVFEHEQEWKKWFSFSSEHGMSDNLYGVLLNANGEVVWRGTGGRDAAGFPALAQAMQTLAR